MTTELLIYLAALTIASTLSILVALAMRRVVQLVFGAAASYSTWLLVPATMLAVLLPTPRNSDSAIEMSLRLEAVTALRHALGSSSLHTAAPIDWTFWALGTWLAGTALSILYLAGLQRAFVNSLGSLSGSRCVLRAQCSGAGPALLGVLWPKIILPADFESRYTRLERLLVLSHERTHLRRGDALWNACSALLRCLFWFNPLVHLAAACFRVDQELACDAAVLREFPRSRRSYANAMLKAQMVDPALPVGCGWQSARHLQQRLEMIRNAMPSHARRTYGRLCVAVASLALGSSVWALQPATAMRVSVEEPAQNAQTAGVALARYPVRILGTGVTLDRGDDFTRLTGAEFQLLIAPGVQLQLQSDRAADGPGETRTFEGHVSIAATRPGSRAASTDGLIASATAMKAVVTPDSGGGLKVRVEHGSVVLRRRRER